MSSESQRRSFFSGFSFVSFLFGFFYCLLWFGIQIPIGINITWPISSQFVLSFPLYENNYFSGYFWGDFFSINEIGELTSISTFNSHWNNLYQIQFIGLIIAPLISIICFFLCSINFQNRKIVWLWTGVIGKLFTCIIILGTVFNYNNEHFTQFEINQNITQPIQIQDLSFGLGFQIFLILFIGSLIYLIILILQQKDIIPADFFFSKIIAVSQNSVEKEQKIFSPVIFNTSIANPTNSYHSSSIIGSFQRHFQYDCLILMLILWFITFIHSVGPFILSNFTSELGIYFFWGYQIGENQSLFLTAFSSENFLPWLIFLSSIVSLILLLFMAFPKIYYQAIKKMNKLVLLFLTFPIIILFLNGILNFLIAPVSFGTNFYCLIGCDLYFALRYHYLFNKHPNFKKFKKIPNLRTISPNNKNE